MQPDDSPSKNPLTFHANPSYHSALSQNSRFHNPSDLVPALANNAQTPIACEQLK